MQTFPWGSHWNVPLSFSIQCSRDFVLSWDFFSLCKWLLFCWKAKLLFFLSLMSSDIWESIFWVKIQIFLQLGTLLFNYFFDFASLYPPFHPPVLHISCVLDPLDHYSQSFVIFLIIMFLSLSFSSEFGDNVLCSVFISFSVSFTIQLARDCLYSVF